MWTRPVRRSGPHLCSGFPSPLPCRIRATGNCRRVGGPSSFTGASKTAGEFAQVSAIPQHSRHPLPPQRFGSRPTGDGSATGGRGQGLLVALAGLQQGGNVTRQLVGLRYEADHVRRPSGCLSGDATGQRGRSRSCRRRPGGWAPWRGRGGDHGPAEAPVPPFRSGVRMRGTCRIGIVNGDLMVSGCAVGSSVQRPPPWRRALVTSSETTRTTVSAASGATVGCGAGNHRDHQGHPDL